MRWILGVAILLAGCAKAPDVAHGRRIATFMGCISCHGERLDGHLFEENADFAIAYSANLSRIVPRRSDPELAATLRTGRRPDGSALWFMPTFAHRAIDDADLRDLLAWLRSVPPSGKDHPAIVRGPQFALALKAGFQDSASEAERLKGREPIETGPATERGRYLTRLACAECHGPDLHGPKDPRPGDAPDLAVAAAYGLPELTTLLRTGRARGHRLVGLMSEEAPKRLHALSDAEIADMHAYLEARAQRR
ncbi:hypothetical protein ASG11_14790 [Sphingomonas sp. Leaf357]|uniref:cytochrome c n=1 Tax=Sphingomonas sp. Leaf357 TaxID=1736350 RepID=UPI0006F8D3E3|nr:cytochrome c [Sphingomonas sp. Leaf357]KQS02063.1 hypothetical protein ASG11_14790 [Sphingomonas sp. Leaf357]